MLTPEQIAALRDWAGHIADPINDFLLEDIARRIAKAGQLTSSASYQIWRAQELGLSQREIKKRLRELLKVSNKELKKLLTQSAQVGYDFDLKRLPHSGAVPFAQNESLQEIVRSAVAMAEEALQNITQTIGMVDPYGKALPLQDAYRSCMDYAFKQVITGAADQNTAIRRATKNLADKGVRHIDYESGVHTSLEAATRRNIMGGLGLMQEQITAATHDEMGCDGWEISAHANSAPDHEPIQGKQYSDAEYQALNNSLVRRISTLNCGHVAFPIILGVNEPQYTPEQLQKFRDDNAKGVTYNGKHYTGYEATQLQRKLERSMRKQKNRILVYEASGDADKLETAQVRLRLTSQEYRRFSHAAGLRTESERAYVAGFGGRQSGRAADAYKRVETAANSMYDVGSSHENVKAWLRDKPLRATIRAGVEYPATIESGQQRKHIPGSHEYNQYVALLAKKGQFGPSRLTISEADAQALVYRYRGTGILPRDRKGRWLRQEWITLHGQTVGFVVNNITGDEAETVTFKIHYGKNGTHVVPDYPSRKGLKSPK